MRSFTIIIPRAEIFLCVRGGGAGFHSYERSVVTICNMCGLSLCQSADWAVVLVNLLPLVGTNNSRIAKMLRVLAVYYQKEPNHLFLVRIAQGCVTVTSLRVCHVFLFPIFLSSIFYS